MLSIGKLAKAANVSARTLRHYESLGLIHSLIRGENNYRYFDNDQLEEVTKIRDLQSLGFSLDEIREVLSLGAGSMSSKLQKRLDSVEHELLQLSGCRERLKSLLSISQRLDSLQAIRLHERKQYMDAVKDEVLSGLRGRKVDVNEVHIEYLRRERGLYDGPEKRAFIEAVKRCLSFATDHHLTLGPGRGSCPASIILYGLGFSGIDPTKYDLIPERLSTMPPDIHIDVEFERGQPFVDFCRKVSADLSWGKITAFKMPLLDIINNVHKRTGRPIDYRSIPDDDKIVLENIQSGNIDKVFLFDYSPDALVTKYENTLPDYRGTTKIKEYLLSQEIQSFRDVVNIISLSRPKHQDNIDRLNAYRDAKLKRKKYDFLTLELQLMLENNFGIIIYHEDLMRIISGYTDWDMERCSKLRRDIRFSYETPDLKRFQELAPQSVFELVMRESTWTFCKAHAMSFAQFTKQTSVLKSLHERIYLEEIEKWQDRNGLVWDDIGIQIKGVSLLQH